MDRQSTCAQSVAVQGYACTDGGRACARIAVGRRYACTDSERANVRSVAGHTKQQPFATARHQGKVRKDGAVLACMPAPEARIAKDCSQTKDGKRCVQSSGRQQVRQKNFAHGVLVRGVQCVKGQNSAAMHAELSG